MKLAAVGSVGLDTVETPHGHIKEAPGGSVVFFGLAASFFTPVAIIANQGEDFPDSAWEVLRSRGADLSGLRTISGEKTFRWQARYTGEMDNATTLKTELNVLAHPPEIPPSHEGAEFLFLANMGPDVQLATFAKARAKRVWADTMNLWIDTQPDILRKVLKGLEGLFLNEEEALQFTQTSALEDAGRALLAEGPQVVIIKQGAKGALLCSNLEVRGRNVLKQESFPAYPSSSVVDPTGAGDSFAGGFLGFLAEHANLSAAGNQINDMAGRADGVFLEPKDPSALSLATLYHAVAAGTAAASLAVESFSTQRLEEADRADVKERMAALLSGHSEYCDS